MWIGVQIGTPSCVGYNTGISDSWRGGIGVAGDPVQSDFSIRNRCFREERRGASLNADPHIPVSARRLGRRTRRTPTLRGLTTSLRDSALNGQHCRHIARRMACHRLCDAPAWPCHEPLTSGAGQRRTQPDLNGEGHVRNPAAHDARQVGPCQKAKGMIIGQSGRGRLRRQGG